MWGWFFFVLQVHPLIHPQWRFSPTHSRSDYKRELLNQRIFVCGWVSQRNGKGSRNLFSISSLAFLSIEDMDASWHHRKHSTGIKSCELPQLNIIIKFFSDFKVITDSVYLTAVFFRSFHCIYSVLCVGCVPRHAIRISHKGSTSSRTRKSLDSNFFYTKLSLRYTEWLFHDALDLLYHLWVHKNFSRYSGTRYE